MHALKSWEIPSWDTALELWGISFLLLFRRIFCLVWADFACFGAGLELESTAVGKQGGQLGEAQGPCPSQQEQT